MLGEKNAQHSRNPEQLQRLMTENMLYYLAPVVQTMNISAGYQEKIKETPFIFSWPDKSLSSG